jgi:hypothetical protein
MMCSPIHLHLARSRVLSEFLLGTDPRINAPLTAAHNGLCAICLCRSTHGVFLVPPIARRAQCVPSPWVRTRTFVCRDATAAETLGAPEPLQTDGISPVIAWSGMGVSANGGGGDRCVRALLMIRDPNGYAGVEMTSVRTAHVFET